MKIFFRLLSFAKPFEKFAIPYFPVTVLAVAFNTLNIAFVIPLLQALFLDGSAQHNVAEPVFHWSFDYCKDVFYFYLYQLEATEGKMGVLKYLSVVIVCSVFLSNLFRYLSQRIIENLRIHTLLNLRRAVFDNVMNLDLGYFNNERKGDIVSKISSDVQVVQYSITGVLQIIIKEPFQLITFFYFLFVISAKLTLFTILVVPISGYIIASIVKKLKHQARSAQESYGSMLSYLDEALSGIKIVKSFNATEFIKKRFHKENENYSDINRRMAARQQMGSPVSEFMGVSMVAVILLQGGSMVVAGELAPESFIGFIALFSQVMRPAKAITDAFSQINQGIAAGERVLELIDTKPKIKDKAGAKVLDKFEKGIELQNIDFSYGEKQVLNGVNLYIPKGKTLALVGSSGGGKSTIMDLLPRFIEPGSGKVLIDGVDIQDYTEESLRSFMGMVSQETVLFNDSVYNNIVFGRNDATIESVQKATKTANAHDFVMMMEQGYETNIGDRGVKLSGGQRQRLCIARAVFANPEILLLDEATSALDTESEKLVQQALNNLMTDRTAVVIAHRLSTIQNADIIAVVDKGQIVEQGTHDELMAQKGLYERLIRMQNF